MGLISCGSHTQHHHENPEYQVTVPLKKDTVIVNEYVCRISSIKHIEIKSQERGYLEKVFVDEGQFVRKGQKLFQIMPNLYQAELEKQRAEMRIAELEYLNTKALADSNIVSENELLMKKAHFDKAKAEFQLAKTHYEFTFIKAPFSGIIDRFYVRPGSLVDEGELLTKLSDNSKMWVYFNVSEAEYLEYMTTVHKGEELDVLLKMANNQLFDYKGKIETIEADFNVETGNIPFRATFSNPKGLLRHGETGNVLLEKSYPNAILIPQKATFEVLDKKYVLLVNDSGIVQMQEVQIQAELPDLFIVESGIDENSVFMLEGLRKVQYGDRIKKKLIPPVEVFSKLKTYAE